MARGSGRERILTAAQSEIEKYGCAGLRIDRVAAAAKINKRMIYHYFDDREGLVRAAMAEFVRALLRAGVSEELANLIQALCGPFSESLDSPEKTVLRAGDRAESAPSRGQRAMTVLLAELLNGGTHLESEHLLTPSDQRRVAEEIMRLVLPRVFQTQRKPVYRLQSESKPTTI
ncbi:MAG: TetR family transcriptional regulator [Pseudomonadales bacterium]|nr:TetR family transcriptional regulator [Pseudomonadales bacterium]